VAVQPGIGFWLLIPPTHRSKFLGRYLGSFLAGTRRLEKKRRIFLDVDFDDVMNLEEGPKLAI
jgi:hypothetical protein